MISFVLCCMGLVFGVVCCLVAVWLIKVVVLLCLLSVAGWYCMWFWLLISCGFGGFSVCVAFICLVDCWCVLVCAFGLHGSALLILVVADCLLAD